MLTIVKKVIDDEDIIITIDTLITDYINNITNCREKLIALVGIKDSLITGTIDMINSFKSILNKNLSDIICANDNISKLPYGKTLTCARDSALPSKSNINDYKETLDNIYNIHDKLLKIQLIFVLIIYNLEKDGLTIITNKEIYAYSAILYKILDNLLILILKILKNIRIYDKDISKYRYSISVRRFYNNMKDSDIIQSYIITTNDNYLFDIDNFPELQNLNMYSNRLPSSLEKLDINEISEVEINQKESEIKTLVAEFASIDKIENFEKLSIKEKISDNKKDYNKEYEQILTNSLNDIYIQDERLPDNKYKAMLRHPPSPH